MCVNILGDKHLHAHRHTHTHRHTDTHTHSTLQAEKPPLMGPSTSFAGHFMVSWTSVEVMLGSQPIYLGEVLWGGCLWKDIFALAGGLDWSPLSVYTLFANCIHEEGMLLSNGGFALEKIISLVVCSVRSPYCLPFTIRFLANGLLWNTNMLTHLTQWSIP